MATNFARIALVVFFGLFALRALSSRRRGRQRSSPPMSSFSGTTSPGQVSDVDDEPSGDITFTGITPCWLTDPSRRHELRYWSGSAWTEHVTDGGVPGIDPPPRNIGGEAS